MEIVLIRPPANKKGLYINPFKLQNLFSSLYHKYGSIVKLVDCQANQFIPPKIEANSVLIIDTPPESVTFFSSNDFHIITQRFSLVIFVGEIVTDGNLSDFINNLHLEIFHFFEDWNLNMLFDLIQKHNADNIFDSTIASNDNYGFNEIIVQSIVERGDRFHLPGISSGCDQKCKFCRLNFSKETSGIVNSAEIDLQSTIKELEFLLDNKPFDIQFTDENFFGGTTVLQKEERLSNIIKLINRLKLLNFSGKIGVDTRIDTVINNSDSPETKEARALAWNEFKKVGLDYVYLGVESASPSQLKRYFKNFKKVNILDSIVFLKDAKINFTIGLILFEPLVAIDELYENIDFIQNNNLHKNTASLLKEMRYYIKSPYVHELSKNGLIKSNKSDDFIKYNPQNILFRDPIINNSIQYIRMVSNLFRSCGYRHSDISRLMTSDKIGNLISEAHVNLIELEIEIIKISLSTKPTHNKKLSIICNYINDFCKNTSGKLDSIPNNYRYDFRFKYYFETINCINKNIYPTNGST